MEIEKQANMRRAFRHEQGFPVQAANIHEYKSGEKRSPPSHLFIKFRLKISLSFMMSWIYKPAQVKVKGGNATGHNGLKSTSQWLGTDDYYRVPGHRSPGGSLSCDGACSGQFYAEDQGMVGAIIKILQTTRQTC